jgi:hypothetical protein
MKRISVISVLLLLGVCATAAAEPATDQLESLRTLKLDSIVAGLSEKDKSDLDPPLMGDFAELKVDGQVRLRWEWWNELDFDTSTASDNAFTLMRTRLGFGVKVDEDVSAYIQMQDSRVWGFEWVGFGPDPTLSTIRNTDVHQAYIEWATPYVEWNVIAGRQEMSFGSERIIGKEDWGTVAANAGRAFDGVRVTCEPTDTLTIDGFVAKVREGIPLPIVWAHRDQDVYGVYASLEGLVGQCVDGYLILLNDTWSGMYPGNDPARFITLGGRMVGKLNALDYEVEAAFQNGDWGTDNLDGWAFRGELGYTMEDMTWTPSLSAQYNWASGDHNPADGHDDTFRPLFPSAHLGPQTDLVGWQNTSNVGVNLCLVPMEKWSAKLGYWLFYREDERPGL